MKLKSCMIKLKLHKLPVFFLVILVLLSTSRSKVFAADNYSTSYKVTYDVRENESTTVNIDIGLTNKSSDFYATSYSVQTGYDDIKNIQVADSTGPLNFKTKKSDNGIQISFDFNDKTVGKGNTQKFSISFDTKQIAKNTGTVWEVNIPGIANQDELSSFSVEVKTPDSFGKPSIVKPKVENLKTSEGSIFFTKSDLGKGGISIAYGDSQAYKFNLNYHIKNKNVFPEITEIAIPSDNSYQQVSISSIDPKPINVILDQDGNWLARFKLLPSQNLTVNVKGKIKVSYLPKSEKLTNEQKKNYLKSQKYWEVNDPEIQKLANKLKTPQNIYDYVTNTLTYDKKRVLQTQIRKGAKEVLKNPQSAVCLEFTDLFIALSRAAGIPARAVEGYANTNNAANRPASLVEDVLHSWPEYWDEKNKTWVMVDPTWGNTTKGIDYFNVLDLDHVSFVINGSQSDYPIPAGGYRTEKTMEQKDVEVTTVNSYEVNNPSINLATDFPKSFYGGLPIAGNLIVTNESKVISPSQTFIGTVEGLKPESQKLFAGKIPPYGHLVIPIKFYPASFLTNKIYEVKISIGQDEIKKQVVILPIYRSLYFAYFLGGILAGILTLTISFIIYRSRRLHFPK